MKISTRNRYGLRALLELTKHYGKGPLMMQIIADNQHVSRKYLDAIFASFKTAGIVRSKRGVGGGHSLARDPATITVHDVFLALDGPVSLVDCVKDTNVCKQSHRCVTRDVWTEMEKAMEGVLDNYTLAGLVEQLEAKSDPLTPCELDG